MPLVWFLSNGLRTGFNKSDMATVWCYLCYAATSSFTWTALSRNEVGIETYKKNYLKAKGQTALYTIPLLFGFYWEQKCSVQKS